MAVTDSHDAVQVSRSVLHTVLHASSVHFWRQVLSASSHFTWQLLLTRLSSQAP